MFLESLQTIFSEQRRYQRLRRCWSLRILEQRRKERSASGLSYSPPSFIKRAHAIDATIAASSEMSGQRDVCARLEQSFTLPAIDRQGRAVKRQRGDALTLTSATLAEPP